MSGEPTTDPICCPEFHPGPWDDRTFEWKNKRFIKDNVRTLFYMPIGFGRVMRRLDKKIREAGATMPDNMGLSDHISRWNMDIYIAVDKEIPGAENTTLNGNFYSKVYEGPYRDTGKWTADYSKILKEKGMEAQNWYMWYTTCPKCAKKYGKNYVVIISELIQS